MDSTADVDLRRIALLDELRLVGTVAEAAFDRFVFTAAQIFRVPIAFIAFIDNDCFRIKARLGLECNEISRHGAFCVATMEANGPLVVDDAYLDDRFRTSQHVLGAPHLRFYAGFPLLMPDGTAVGTLCVADTRARSATDPQIWALTHLARAVLDTLLMRLSPAAHPNAA